MSQKQSVRGTGLTVQRLDNESRGRGLVLKISSGMHRRDRDQVMIVSFVMASPKFRRLQLLPSLSPDQKSLNYTD